MSPATDMVDVTEAADEIKEDAEAEDVVMVEEVVEGTAGCDETTHMRNGRISQRRRRHRSARLGIRRRTASRALFFTRYDLSKVTKLTASDVTEAVISVTSCKYNDAADDDRNEVDSSIYARTGTRQ